MTHLTNTQNVRTSTHNKIIITYVIENALLKHLKIPVQFQLLAKDQQQDIFMQLIKLSPDLQQAVLNEWAIRCQTETIYRPVGYLFQLINKAQQAIFRPCAGLGVQYQAQNQANPKPEQNSDNTLPVDTNCNPQPEQAKQKKPVKPEDYRTIAQPHLTKLKNMFGRTTKMTTPDSPVTATVTGRINATITKDKIEKS